MTKNEKRIGLSLVIVLIAFSVCAFMMPFQKNGVFWSSYLFGVVAIAVQLYVMKVAFAGSNSVKSKFYGFPIARISVIYMTVQILLSILFMALSAIAAIWLPVIIYVLALAAGAIGFIGTEAAKEEIEGQDIRIEADTSRMLELRSMTNALASQCEDTEVKKELSKLAEEFKYSDPVSSEVTGEMEEVLKKEVEDLRALILSQDVNALKIKCQSVSSHLLKRNQICKMNKARKA